MAVPKLGELRQLPRVESAPQDRPPPPTAAPSVGANIAFIMLSLIAAAALLGAAYCGIRWALIEADENTETHMAEIAARYEKVDPSVLIREYEDMEEYSVDLVAPYNYKVVADEKRKWGWNAVIAGCVGLFCGIAGLLAASRSPGKGRDALADDPSG
ncbi:hypothetical protein FYK55_15665 [Roseiconus nitratireducens]|uniref:Uncharacterized protein n=1 Tax=Roseiconus nitratireducens TaxID=2605748 RepID=A0A5M6D401_9BACT|nr:hypothetical protein [Roseiconus nitratireducens]KAA5542238.1 hypothetical protein FYK55_15665 [Roseiconus nitratireducens]